MKGNEQGIKHRQAIATDCIRFFILPLFDGPLNRANATQMLFEFLFSMPIRFIDGFGRFPHIMKVA